MQNVHKTSTGNFTYKQYVFIPLGGGCYRFCGQEFDSIDAVKADIDAIIARKAVA